MQHLNDNNKCFERVSSVDSCVGARLQLGRELAGLSQSELAKELGTGVEKIAQYELGILRMSIVTLFEATRILAQPVGWFFEDINAERSNDSSKRTL